MPLVDKSKGGFNLGDYVEVKDRIRLFYEAWPTGALVTGDVRISVDDDTPRVIVQAFAYRTPDDPHPGVGWSWMVLPGSTSYTKGSELENTETSAWGRAIGSLGIGIDKSIASANEVRGKAGEDGRPDRPPLTRDVHDGLIGTFATSGTQDAQLRETPDGWMLPFRLKDGAKAGQICIAHDELAVMLGAMTSGEDGGGDIIGQRVTVWGRYEDLEIVKAGKTIGYKVLHVTRITGADFDFPATVESPPVEAPSAPLFPDDDLTDVAGYE
jgi:hypothetical protein